MERVPEHGITEQPQQVGEVGQQQGDMEQAMPLVALEKIYRHCRGAGGKPESKHWGVTDQGCRKAQHRDKDGGQLTALTVGHMELHAEHDYQQQGSQSCAFDEGLRTEEVQTECCEIEQEERAAE